jgi:predicted ATPase
LIKGDSLFGHSRARSGRTTALHRVHRNTARAEQSFRTAIEIARNKHAKSWQLRSVTSLTRLLAKQGKRDQARAMVAEAYDWFTEGFDTGDLKGEKALLEELAG